MTTTAFPVYGVNDVYFQLNTNSPDLNAFAVIESTNLKGLALSVAEARPLIFGTARTERMRVAANGFVGIGTTNPSLLSGGTGRMLEISDAASPGLALTNKGTGGNQFFLYSRTEGSSNTGSFRIYDATNGVDRFALNNNGNVGIGTTAPTAKLDVVGGIRATSQANAIVGYSTTPSFAAIYGENLTTGSFGVYGKASSPGGTGVHGEGSPGVVGHSPSGGIGVYGISNVGSGKGVYGDGVYGVYGVSAASGGRGVYGEGSYAIYGKSDNYAGYFEGSVNIREGGLSVHGIVVAEGYVEYSDFNAKANFSKVDPRSILHRLASIPIQTWNFKNQSESVRHLGPVGQDFRAAFNLGHDDKHISTIDANGVALAAIQGLYQIVQEKDKQLKQQARLLQEQSAQLQQLQERLQQVERLVKQQPTEKKR